MDRITIEKERVMENLEKLVEQGKALAEKHSWVKDAHEKMVNRINFLLAQVPPMKEPALLFFLGEEWHSPEYGRRIYARLSFQPETLLDFEECPVGDCSYVRTISLSLPTIRAFGEKFEEMAEFFLDEIEKRSAALEPAKIVFEKLLREMRDEPTRRG